MRLPLLPRLGRTAFLAALAPLATTAQTVEQAFTAPAPPTAAFESFGADVCSVGDVNGDGVSDFAVVALRTGLADPSIRVFSGADQSILLSLDLGSYSSDHIRIDGMGDADNDGIDDLIVGLPHYPSVAASNGQARLFSLRTGELIRVHEGVPGELVGYSVAGVGDVTLSTGGYEPDEYGVGAPGGGVGGGGKVTIYSSNGGFEYHTQLGLPGTALGRAIDHAPATGGSSFANVIAGGDGAAMLFRPYDGVILQTHSSLEATYGHSVAGSWGPSIGYYWVGSPQHDVFTSFPLQYIPNAGAVYQYHASTGDLLRHYTGSIAGEELGFNIDSHPGTDYVALGGRRVAVVIHKSAAEPVAALANFPSSSGDDLVRVAIDGNIDGSLPPGIFAAVPGVHDAAQEDGLVQLFDFAWGGDPVVRAEISARTGRGFGETVAHLGDIDGDGVYDTVIAAPHEDENGYDSGAVRAYSGTTGLELWEYAGILGAQAGSALATLDDLDDDGVPELAVGEPRRFTGSVFTTVQRGGYVRVLSGKTGAPLYAIEGEKAGDHFGAALASVGDVTGDAIADLAVGSPGRKWYGHVGLYSGADGALVNEWTGQIVNGRLGGALASLGDTNGDGSAELAVGSAGIDYIEVVSLPNGNFLWGNSGGPDSAHGTALANVGDVDGDGVNDFATGAPTAPDPGLPSPTPVGRVRVLSGSDGHVISEQFGSTEGEHFGAAVAGTGDIDGDGIPEYAVGVPRYSSGASAGVGRVAIYSGVWAPQPVREWIGAEVGGHLGSSIVGGLDADGDGIPDLLAGSSGYAADWGAAQALNVRAAGTQPFGTGTEGCAGMQLCIASRIPSPGTYLELRGTNAVPGSTAFLGLSLGQDMAGTDLGYGFLVHWDLFQQILIMSRSADASGHVAFDLPVPADAGLIGVDVFAQAIFSSVADPCPQLPFSVSSSAGLQLTVQ